MKKCRRKQEREKKTKEKPQKTRYKKSNKNKLSFLKNPREIRESKSKRTLEVNGTIYCLVIYIIDL